MKQTILDILFVAAICVVILMLMLAMYCQAQGIASMNLATGTQFGHISKIAIYTNIENQYQQSDSVCRVWVTVTALPEINFVWKDFYEIGDKIALRTDRTVRLDNVIYFNHDAVLGRWVECRAKN